MIKPVDPGRPIRSITHITDRPTQAPTMKRTSYSVARAQQIIRRACGYAGQVIVRPDSQGGPIIQPWPGSSEVLRLELSRHDRNHYFVHRHELASFVQYLRSL